MSVPPQIIFRRRAIHRAFDITEIIFLNQKELNSPIEWTSKSAWTVTSPHMLLVMSDLGMERMIDRDVSIGNSVDSIHVRLKLRTVAIASFSD